MQQHPITSHHIASYHIIPHHTHWPVRPSLLVHQHVLTSCSDSRYVSLFSWSYTRLLQCSQVADEPDKGASTAVQLLSHKAVAMLLITLAVELVLLHSTDVPLQTTYQPAGQTAVLWPPVEWSASQLGRRSIGRLGRWWEPGPLAGSTWA